MAALLVALAFVASGCGTLSRALEPPTSVSSALVAERPVETASGDSTLPPLPDPGSPSPELAAISATGRAVSDPAAVSEAPLLERLTNGTRELAVRDGADVPPAAPVADAGNGSAAAALTDTAEGFAAAQVRDLTDAVPEDYDPWEPYNERMFAFNYNVDRYALKPAANVYRHIVPEPFQLMIANGFDNIRYPPRLVNLMLQGRFWGAFVETSRFVINSVLGVGGLFNPATDYFGIPKASADFGQTLHKWGVGPGPFFVPPFLPPATVRDFIGRLADSALNPIAWFLIDFWPEAFAIGAGEMLNERAVNYEAFQGVEETTLDLYTAVRDGYLRRRERQLQRIEE